jgi:hypothetical protein
MAPKIRVEPCSLPITAEVLDRRDFAMDGGGTIRILDGNEADVDCVILLDAGEVRLRCEVDSRPVGLADLTVLFVEETGRLFLRGRRLSSVVDLARKTVEHSFGHCLFWASIGASPRIDP